MKLPRAAGGGFTVTEALTVAPEYEPDTVTGVALLTVPAVTVKVAEVEPCGTVTDAGIVTAPEDFDSVMEAPPLGAADVSCRVAVADWPLLMVFGDTVRPLRAAGIGLTVRVAVTVTPE